MKADYSVIANFCVWKHWCAFGMDKFGGNGEAQTGQKADYSLTTEWLCVEALVCFWYR